SGFHWLSLSIGYLKDNLHLEDMSNLLKIFGDVGFPIISVPNEIIDALNNSIHKDFLKVLSPAIGRIYLKHNRDRWQDQLSKEEAIVLFNESIVNNHGLRNRLRELAIDGWNLNIKILDAYAIADMIRFTLDPVNPFLEEMQYQIIVRLYPSNLNCVLQPREISMLVEYLSNYLRFVANDASNVIDVIKHLPIFSEVGNATSISLIGNQNWYLLPYGENNSYGEIIYPSE
ncbi:13469_t:CDS:2, partial [Funneliformis mosseae]